LFEFLYSVIGQNILKANITGSAQGGLNSTNLKAIKIPLPPLDIQQQVVSECEKVDEEYNNSRMTIEEYKKKIAEVFERLEVISKSGGG
jgi:restriction endonuclease S subunit